MKKIFTAILILAYTFSLQSQIYSYEWLRKANLEGGKRDRACSFSLAGYGYICTGMDSNNIVLKDLWQYDTLLDTWTQKADLPGVARRDAVAFVLGNKAYVGTGIDDSSTASGIRLNDMYAYDALSNTWTAIAPYANGVETIFRAVGLSVNGKAYVVGGRRFSPIRDLWEYDPLTNFWTEKTQMPMGDGRSGAVGCVMGNTFYFGMGQDDNYYHHDWYQYVPAADTWYNRPALPAAERVNAVSFVFDGYIMVGLGSNGGYLNDFWRYDTSLHAWSYVNEFGGSSRRSAVSFVVGNTPYVYGGKANSGTKKDLWKIYKQLIIVDTTEEPTPISTYESGEEIRLVCNSTTSSPIQIQSNICCKATLYTLSGKCCISFDIKPGTQIIPTQLSPSCYILYCHTPGYSSSHKFLIQ